MDLDLNMSQMAIINDNDSSDEDGKQPNTTKNANGKRRGPKIKHGNSVRKPTKVKKVKSLGNFCQQFIRLFVTWKNVISLEEAALRISDGESLDDKMLKTKIRRLYDIANVLQSIGLIRKTQMIECRKPAFKWIGLNGTIRAIQEIKELVQATRDELNTIQKHGGKDKFLHLALTKTLSQRVQTNKQANVVAEDQSKVDKSPRKLKRSNSFIECSPAQGSLEFSK
jgi:hypothetical protein